MKKIIKNRIFIVIITMLICVSGTLYATTNYKASEISYNPSNGEATNVNDALNYLYENINTGGCTSNVAPPEIKGNLIPITISNDGTVKYADTSKKWYNYCNKEWANAVILEDNKTYKVGDTIPEEDIESYFVWIPKYRYKLWNTGTASKIVHLIELEFDTENTTDVEGYSCITPLESGETGNCDNGEYMTHPAFITFNTNGFWVGKFETGYKGATSTSSAKVNSNDSTKVIIKPNVYSWRSITVYNAFLTSYNYERNLDSHMMKNIEWGAVAYLSHSKYGIGYEVNINNNSSYKTGYSALPSTYQQTYPGTYGDGEKYNQLYNTEIGYLASTTGNISGIYDLNGGANEYMASYRSGTMGSSGFTTTTTKDNYIGKYDSKYFDVYNASSSATTYQYRILGDATGEMGPFKSYIDTDGSNDKRYHSSWYNDNAYFINSSAAWFYRGSDYSSGVIAGNSFGSMTSYSGSAQAHLSFRLVLTP